MDTTRADSPASREKYVDASGVFGGLCSERGCGRSQRILRAPGSILLRVPSRMTN
jgi:hypothetical protein